MNVRLLHQLPPTENNPRNSEGSFIRGKNGEILFAYSRYTGNSWNDHASCDIALIVSLDEGRTWSESRIIAKASDYCTTNIMSVSSLTLSDGRIAFFYLIKRVIDNNVVITEIGRSVSEDGVSYKNELCRLNADDAYYVICNDRFIRLSNGRIVAPVAYVPHGVDIKNFTDASITSCIYSDDDGLTFEKARFDLSSAYGVNSRFGLQEPGIMERRDGLYLWMRTGYGMQYESFSASGVEGFCEAHPSSFPSALAPMLMREYKGVIYCIYNPFPRYEGFEVKWEKAIWRRNPLVIRKSLDGGNTFGGFNIIEDEHDRDYSYPATFMTKDSRLLVAYCRGNKSDGDHLCRIGIAEIEIETIK